MRSNSSKTVLHGTKKRDLGIDAESWGYLPGRRSWLRVGAWLRHGSGGSAPTAQSSRGGSLFALSQKIQIGAQRVGRPKLCLEKGKGRLNSRAMI